VSSIEQAREAGTFAGLNGHSEAITANRGGVNPWPARLNSKIVDQKSRFEVVCAVKNHVKIIQQLFDIARVDICYEAFDGNAGIDSAQFALRRNSLRQSFTCIRLVKQILALQIGGFHEIPIHDTYAPDAGPHQQIGSRRSNGAAPGHHRAGTQQMLLSV
jgi:hypothetical protein